MYGLSFSLHRCSELGLDKKALLQAAISDLGVTRYRLMSYWNIHEKTRGVYDFSELDWQLDMVAAAGGSVTMCLGVRQPRWPEFHMPAWASQLPAPQWHAALADYIHVVVERYISHPALVSWQLENEALLKSFGDNTKGDFDRARLKNEFNLVKTLDPSHPIIMTLSDSWGVPVFGPKPDQFAMSLYRITINQQGQTVYSKRPALFYRIRMFLIRLLHRRSTFIHELQAEPWVNQAIADVPVANQLIQMGAAQLTINLTFACATHTDPIDVWGLEWWYWLKTQKNEDTVWQIMINMLI